MSFGRDRPFGGADQLPPPPAVELPANEVLDERAALPRADLPVERVEEIVIQMDVHPSHSPHGSTLKCALGIPCRSAASS